MASIKHVVVLMMENRSFDHMLGYLKAAGMDVDGVTGRTNALENGQTVRGHHLEATRLRAHPHHDVQSVAKQINGGKMDGFVKGYGFDAHVDEIMSWFDDRDVWSYDSLARQYAVCDRWFASVPGPTWPNRFYAMCGTSTGIQGNLEPINHQTFFDLLPPNSWRYYSHDIAFLRTVKRYTGHVGAPIDKIGAFYRACDQGTLPSVSWIDPNFTLVHVDALVNWANDDHPPADIKRGQNLVARIYNRLIASPCWSETLFIVAYDEHGGFYDHVAPEPTLTGESAPFDQYGVRVPALVISPWVARGRPFHETLDHTCIARTALELFAPDQVNNLSPRVSKARSLLPLLSEPAPRDDAEPLEGMPVVEQAIAPVNVGNVPSRLGHSMIRTDMQEGMEQLKQRARELNVPDERH